MTIKVLIAEDESRMREVITMLLSDLPLQFLEAGDGKTAIDIFENENIGLVITDLQLPNTDGMEVLKYIKEKDPEIPAIVVTAYGSIDNAVEAIRLGAFDYVTKPFKEDRLRACVEKALRISRLVTEVRHLRREIEKKYNFDNIQGNSSRMVDLLENAGEVAQRDTTVLITGESGTGKELLSRAIHFNSRRWAGPFLPVNCAAIPPTLLEAELFGYEEGAFTGASRRKKGQFELASSGTMFLDEIGDMGIDVQASLLRVLEQQQFQRLGGTSTIQVNVRIIAATNKALEKLVETGKFREDLYYRINVFPLKIPPLRKRSKDIILLSNYFIKQFSKSFGRTTPPVLTRQAKESLMANPWKGNIRELKNVIERAMILCKGNQIGQTSLILNESFGSRLDKMSIEKLVPLIVGDNGVDIVAFEKELLRYAIKNSEHNVSKAARLLGLTRPTLRYRLEKHKIRI
ncbi:sigma-54 dependent transcriptional regulator [Desulfobacterales bacterium HSG16]|nr:sigma-54 dependent transcriptional regulator [Desulfobacterales bacterium HSG16]